MDTDILKDLGLTNAEIRIYLSLLELGPSTAGPVIEKSGLQSSVVHIALRKLIEKGLISFVKEGKWKQYQASEPGHIIEFIDEKKRRLENILPELIAKQRKAKEKREVTTFIGIRGIKELLYELLDAGGFEHHTFGSSKESLMLGDAWWIAYHKKRAKKKIKAKLLFNESLSSWKAEKKYPLTQIKYTDRGFEPLTETILRNDKMGIIIWTKKPIGILIHNKTASLSYDNFFNIIWDSAV